MGSTVYAIDPAVKRNYTVNDYIRNTTREHQEKVGKIRLHPSGIYVNPLAMRARDIRIVDIAHHLSNLCRYTGACPKHYSVAHHSILVSMQLEEEGAPRPLQLAGLLHDAGEYVFNDIASPVKKDPRMKWYRDLEHETTRMIFCVFGLDPDLLALTKPADDALFHAEVATWWGGRDLIAPVRPFEAEIAFLTRFKELTE